MSFWSAVIEVLALMPFCKEKEDTVVSPEFPMVVLLFYRDSHDETHRIILSFHLKTNRNRNKCGLKRWNRANSSSSGMINHWKAFFLKNTQTQRKTESTSTTITLFISRFVQKHFILFFNNVIMFLYPKYNQNLHTSTHSVRINILFKVLQSLLFLFCETKDHKKQSKSWLCIHWSWLSISMAPYYKYNNT